MSDNNLTNKVMNIKSHRLSKKEIDDNFSDLHAPLSAVSYTHLTLPTNREV